MIYITGDTHGMIDWEKLNTTEFPDQYGMTRDDYVIVLGDFGGVWDGGKQDRHILKTYGQRSFTTLFIDGNHENHDLLDKYPVEEWNGGKIHRISDNVIHLMRGQVFTIDGMKIFAMGGAESTDREYRREGESWWAREMPSDEEYQEALENLRKVDFKVDIVLTHCAPEDYAYSYTTMDVARNLNKLTAFFSGLITDYTVSYDAWYFGHYHTEIDYDKFHCLYRRIVEI